MQSYTDEQLMHIFQQDRVNQGPKALDCLYQRYAQKLLNYFYFSLNKDHSTAQDFVQDVFVKVMENPYRFDANQPFKPWLYRVAANMCKNLVRDERVVQKYQSHVMATSSLHIETVDEATDFIKDCINALETGQRSLIVLRFKLKLTVKEIAGVYECPEGTIKSRLFYAVKELTKKYQKQEK